MFQLLSNFFIYIKLTERLSRISSIKNIQFTINLYLIKQYTVIKDIVIKLYSLNSINKNRIVY